MFRSSQSSQGQQQKVESKAAYWFKTVFMRKKEYVPGDTYRFIWQKVPEIQGSFVIYRVIHLMGNLLVFIVSFFHISQPQKRELCKQRLILCSGNGLIRLQFEWFFYATSVGLTINLIQAVWAMVLALWTYYGPASGPNTRDGEAQRPGRDGQPADVEAPQEPIVSKSNVSEAQNPRDQKNFRYEKFKCGRAEHNLFTKTGIYWGLHSYAVCGAIMIDIVYWPLIWPKLSTYPGLFFIQFDEHLLNLPLMLVDYAVVAFPVVPSHLWYAAGISSAYTIINVVYFLAGGLNQTRTKHYLYGFLDWKKPGKALVYSFGVTISICLFLCIFLIIDHYKFKLRPRTLYVNPINS